MKSFSIHHDKTATLFYFLLTDYVSLSSHPFLTKSLKNMLLIVFLFHIIFYKANDEPSALQSQDYRFLKRTKHLENIALTQIKP